MGAKLIIFHLKYVTLHTNHNYWNKNEEDFMDWQPFTALHRCLCGQRAKDHIGWFKDTENHLQW
jgi:hypothetical protein